MEDRILVADVFKETVAFFKHKIKFIAGAFAITLLVAAPFEWQVSLVQGTEFPPYLWVTFAGVMIAGTLIQVCAFNNFIQTLRCEDAPFVPQGVIGRFFKTLLKEFLLLFVLILPAVVIMACVGAIAVVLLMPEAFSSGDIDVALSLGDTILLTIFNFLGVLLGFGLLGVRWGAIISAAAVGENMSFKDSWRMTKGYTFSLLLFTVPLFIVQSLSQVLLDPIVESGGSLSFFSLEMISMSILSSFAYWFTYVAFSVWYVRLTRLRAGATVEVENEDEEPL